MKFRKKSLVEAELWSGYAGNGIEWSSSCGCYGMMTKQGWQQVNYGDYIITNPDGEKYPCNAKTFEDTYERVE